MITLVTFRHMFLKGGVAMLAVVALMSGDALQAKVNLYLLCVIHCRYLPPDMLIRNTVLVPVFPKDDVVILLNLSLGAMLEYKGLLGQG